MRWAALDSTAGEFVTGGGGVVAVGCWRFGCFRPTAVAFVHPILAAERLNEQAAKQKKETVTMAVVGFACKHRNP